jgi:hypothetical protein
VPVSIINRGGAMLRRAEAFGLTAFLAAVAGCSGSGPVPQPSTTVPVKPATEVLIELPFGGAGMAPAAGPANILGGGHRIVISDGRLTIDGKPHGTVEAGDRVKVEKSGAVLVNGQAREPDGT